MGKHTTVRIASFLLALVLLSTPACADTLTGKTPANTYKDLLQISNSNSGVDDTFRAVEDGEGSSTPLQLSTSGVNINSGWRLGGTTVTDQALSFLKGNGYYTTPTGASSSRLIEDLLANKTYAANFGAKCDGFQVLDIDIANGAATATSQNYSFPASLEGASFELTNNSETTVPVTGTITDADGSNTITLSTTWTGTTITANTGRLTIYRTDNTAALQAGLDAVRDRAKDDDGMALKGGTLVIPEGLCYTGPLALHTRTLIEGQGVNTTTLFLKTGSNAALLQTDNYATLVGGNLTYGNGVAAGSSNLVPVAAGVKDIQLEGNKAGNATGTNSVFNFYGGIPLILGDVEVGSCDYNCINLYGSTSFAYSTNDRWSAEEGRVDRLFLRNWVNYGIYINGIHDSIMGSITGTSAQGSYGFYNENIGSPHIDKIHIYATGDGRGAYIGGGSTTIGELYCDFAGCVIAAGVDISRIKIASAGYLGISGLVVAADYVNIGEIKWGWYSAATSGSIAIDVQSGSDFVNIGVINGSSVFGPTNGTNVKWRGNFGSYNILGGGCTASGCKCNDAGGTLNRWHQSTVSCLSAVSYTAGGNNRMSLFHYMTGSDVLWTGGLGVGDERYVCDTATGAHNDCFSQRNRVGEAASVRVITASGAVTATYTDRFIDLNKTVGEATTVNLPACDSSHIGFLLTIKDMKRDASSNNITIDPAGSDDIDTASTLVLSTNGASANLHCASNTHWVTH